jgi:hypothetical protein
MSPLSIPVLPGAPSTAVEGRFPGIGDGIGFGASAKGCPSGPVGTVSGAARRSNVTLVLLIESYQGVLAATSTSAPTYSGCIGGDVGPSREGRVLAVVATLERFGSCDGAWSAGSGTADGEAGAVRAVDCAGCQ